MSIFISPSILSADFKYLERDLLECERAGADFIHVDVMDGSFVPNITFGPVIVKTCKEVTNLPLDVHLMIREPEKHLKAFVDAGANIITVHYETCPHIHRTLQTIRELGATPGITFNPGTGIDPLKYLVGVFDSVLLMTVNPGFGGQTFIPQMLKKIRNTHELLHNNGSNAIIQVDGGVDEKTVKSMYEAGARNFVAGTAVFKHPEGISKGISALRASI